MGCEETCVTNAWMHGTQRQPTKQSCHAKARCLKDLVVERMAVFMEPDWSENKAVQKVVKAMEDKLEKQKKDAGKQGPEEIDLGDPSKNKGGDK